MKQSKADTYVELLEYCRDKTTYLNDRIKSLAENLEPTEWRSEILKSMRERAAFFQDCVDLLSEEYPFHVRLLEGRD